MKGVIQVKVPMGGEKTRTKALKTAAGVPGVESASLKGDLLKVIGEGVDPVKLTRLLKKSVSYAELVSFGPVKELNEPAPLVPRRVAPEPPPQLVWMPPPPSVPPPPPPPPPSPPCPPPPPYDGFSYGYPVNETRDQVCTIM